MNTAKLADNVYSIGVLNPSLRIFDIVMRTEFGTSYNAYFVQGEEKCALIDTVHENFFDEYMANIGSVASVSGIDYIVVNHTEPDHSGSIARLLALNPSIAVVGTAAAHKYLQAILNRPYTAVTVKQGDELDLGNRVLRFTPAPFLHWPDSMFTFDTESGIAFTCDFFGAHFCEPRLYADLVGCPARYKEAFRYYFDGIFGPFKPHVLEGIAKLEALDPEMIAVSHGPVIRADLKKYIGFYKEWAQEGQKDDFTLIAYASAYGYTEALAASAAKALTDKGEKVRLIDLVTAPQEEVAAWINDCSCLLIGTDTVNRDATKPVWDALAAVDAIGARNKPAGAFGSYGWSGEAVGMVKSRLEGLKFKFVGAGETGEGFRVNFKPTEDDLKAMGEYALTIHNS